MKTVYLQQCLCSDIKKKPDVRSATAKHFDVGDQCARASLSGLVFVMTLFNLGYLR